MEIEKMNEPDRWAFDLGYPVDVLECDLSAAVFGDTEPAGRVLTPDNDEGTRCDLAEVKRMAADMRAFDPATHARMLAMMTGNTTT
jgi:hypothetical protein